MSSKTQKVRGFFPTLPKSEIGSGIFPEMFRFLSRNLAGSVEISRIMYLWNILFYPKLTAYQVLKSLKLINLMDSER